MTRLIKIYLPAMLAAILLTGLVFGFLLNAMIIPALTASLILIILFAALCRTLTTALRDIEYFTQAIQFNDFTKRYPTHKGPKARLYNCFNRISHTLAELDRKREISSQHSEKILSLVNTGILAYQLDTGEVLWMNQAFRDMFKIPTFKRIRQLENRHRNLYQNLIDLPAAGEGRILTVNKAGQTIKTIASSTRFLTEGRTYKLITLYNISSTMDEIEARAWKSLLSVMTHEIMNSITPIVSLADTLTRQVQIISRNQNSIDKPDLEDLELAIDTIRQRIEGLLRFADTYRNLSKTIHPRTAPCDLNTAADAVYRLMRPSIQQKNINLELRLAPTTVPATIDRDLIEQTLINFITNAAHALHLRPNPQIILISGFTSDNRPCLTVADNGCGISPDLREKIFIPFFSTRPNGSGIGLSISREIIKLHKAELILRTEQQQGSAFTIVF